MYDDIVFVSSLILENIYELSDIGQSFLVNDHSSFHLFMLVQ
jgi:hypothetical protein